MTFVHSYQQLLDRKEITWVEYIEAMASQIPFASIADKNNFRMWMGERHTCGAIVNPQLWYRCFEICRRIRHDKDHFIIVNGKEGVGKSTLALHLASIISPTTFRMDNICYIPTDFIRLLMNNPAKYDSVILDEGALFLFNKDTHQDINKNIVKLFTTLRKFNLVYIVCIPNYFLLDTYIRYHRVGTLINVFEEGKVTIFNEFTIPLVNSKGRTLKKIPSPDNMPAGWTLQGQYAKHVRPCNDVTWDSYLAHKNRATDRFLKELWRTYADTDKNKFLQNIVPNIDDRV